MKKAKTNTGTPTAPLGGEKTIPVTAKDAASFFDMIKKWMVLDFRTSNIPAEVIVDMLISEFIADMVKYWLYLEDAQLVGKEFLLPRVGQEEVEANENLDETKKERQHASADFLVYDKRSTYYLVELKTTNSSLNGEQLLNMLWTCNQGMESLYHRYRDVIVNYCLGAKVNDLQAKKSLYALKKMTEGEIDCSSFGMKRQPRNTDLKKRQQDDAEKILSAVFKDECRNAKLKILYITLHDEIGFEKIKEKVWPRENLDKVVNAIVGKLEKSGKHTQKIMRIREFANNLDEKFLAEHIADAPILLEKLMEDKAFEDALVAKKHLWRSAKAILKSLAEPSENWFGAEK